MSVITKSPYISAPNILDTPDCETKAVTLTFGSRTCIKAGSPISAAGKVANDETAIGIMLTDCYAVLGNRRGLVVISGRIKQDVAQEHSGITISDKAKAALVNISFTGDGERMGVVPEPVPESYLPKPLPLDCIPAPLPTDRIPTPLTYDHMPEGYPRDDSWSIEWDGDPTGLIVVDERYYKVSDTVLTAADLIGAIITRNAEATTSVSAANITEGDGYISIEDGMLVIVSEENAVYDGMTFPETGIYFEGTFDDPVYGDEYVASLAKIAITQMSEEFMPLLTSPNGTKYKLTVDNAGTLSAVEVE